MKSDQKKSFFAIREEELQKYWADNKTFEKSIEQRDEKNSYVFYDGPPFATGTPHYGHIVASVMKDIAPRYWTMKGKRVERKWGWDCHGLPIENIVEKELGVKSKKEIEEMGVEKFNELCRAKVLSYVDVWKQIVPRIGRWADMEKPYKTMDKEYMESIWWVFKELWDKDLIYKSYKSMHVCPRCETTLSQQEVAEGYKDIKDLSLTAKFELTDEPGTYVLAWTTTPWTLPGNVALAVGADLNYVKVEFENAKYILVKDLLEKIFTGKEFKVLEEFKGASLRGKKYKPLFDYFINKDLPNKDSLYTIETADFVSTEDGTGVVHIAPAFGEDDMNLGKEKNLSFIQHVSIDGRFTDDVKDFAGLSVKPIEDPQATDVKVLKYLAEKGLLFSKEKYAHSYPHCWRCDTPLINYATSSWFVKVTEVKDTALKTAKKINWVPEHLKEGRFGKWLEGARDWSISRQRFWASVMPVWHCAKCDDYKVYGSVAELEKDSGVKINDLHKHIVDKITVPCAKCGETRHRIPDVLDTWFDSGSMPYAQMHYPFENKEKFEANFPAEFIAEGVDQTRAWFYYLHVLSNALFKKNCYKNVVVNGIVLAEDGRKMSKRLSNYPDPMYLVDKYSADAMRYYLTTSGVMKAQDLCFSEKGVDEVYKKIILITLNVLNFYLMYAETESREASGEASLHLHENVMDKWILAKLNEFVKDLTEKMDGYDLTKSAVLIGDFINELSTWYVRRSRDRFKSSDENEKNSALATLQEVLKKLALAMAPFMPFMAEHLWQKLNLKDSVHLQDWPEVEKKAIDKNLLKNMGQARQVVELALAARDEAKMKIRQSLQTLNYSGSKLAEEFEKIIAEELNVKEVVHQEKVGVKENWIVKELAEVKVALNTELTDELRAEGTLRELIRQVNNLRKNSGLTINDKIKLYWQTDGASLKKVFENDKLAEELKRSVLAKEVINEATDTAEEVKVNGEVVRIEVVK
jgi:isoleucyl-tRNA synthetase